MSNSDCSSDKICITPGLLPFYENKESINTCQSNKIPFPVFNSKKQKFQVVSWVLMYTATIYPVIYEVYLICQVFKYRNMSIFKYNYKLPDVIILISIFVCIVGTNCLSYLDNGSKILSIVSHFCLLFGPAMMSLYSFNYF